MSNPRVVIYLLSARSSSTLTTIIFSSVRSSTLYCTPPTPRPDGPRPVRYGPHSGAVARLLCALCGPHDARSTGRSLSRRPAVSPLFLCIS